MTPEPVKRIVLFYWTSAGINVFNKWLCGLKDARTRAAIRRRIDRLEEGLLGDHRYVGEGVWELRIDFGPGYRIYFGEDGLFTVLLLLGGDKGSQQRDIRKAQAYWFDYRRQK